MMDTHQKMVHAVTDYDRKQLKRKDFNPYALAQYFEAIGYAESDVVKYGMSLELAINDHFCGRLEQVLLKAIK